MLARKSKLIVLLLVFLLTIIACKTSFSNSQSNHSPYDVSRHVEYLGIPYAQRYKSNKYTYARNVWDLQTFEGKLYVAGGNSSNIGPATNAGPVPVIFWNPQSNKFESEFTVDEEQIDAFYALEGDLYIPGHDAKESWEYGNLYRFSENRWQKYRNITDAIHVYALSAYKKLLFAGLTVSLKDKKQGVISAVGISTDWGKTWNNNKIKGLRIHEFLQAKGFLYSTDLFLGVEQEKHIAKNNLQHVSVHEFSGEGNIIERPDLSTEVIFPNFRPEGLEIFKITKPQNWNSGTVYLGGKSHNDHHSIPFGIFYASDLRKDRVSVQQLKIPENTKPWDLIIRNNILYVLLAKEQKESTEISVIATTDMEYWQTVLQFNTATFARSFEILNGDFYFGLGSEIENPLDWKQQELSSKTGQILRVREKYLNQAS